MTDEEAYLIGTLIAHLCGAIERFDDEHLAKYDDVTIMAALEHTRANWRTRNPGMPDPIGQRMADAAVDLLLTQRELIREVVDADFQKIVEGYDDDGR